MSGAAEQRTPDSQEYADSAVALVGIHKAFDGAAALVDANLVVDRATIHGLVGQNGSGKSTLLKILAGFHQADSGKLYIRGNAVSLPVTEHMVSQLGVGFVHQELGLINSLSVSANLRLGSENVGGSRLYVSRRKDATDDQLLLEEFGVDVEASALVGSIDLVHRTQVAVARALRKLRLSGVGDGQGVLCLDEPMVYLPRHEREILARMIRDLAQRGNSVILVSHDIDEVRDLSSVVTVLRDGRTVLRAKQGTADSRQLISEMLGRAVLPHETAMTEGSRSMTGQSHTRPSDGASIRISALSGTGVQAFDLELSPGEVLGVTGLLGSGFEHIPYLLLGAEQASSGVLTLDRKNYELHTMDPARALTGGIVLIPGDRRAAGAIMNLTLAENIILPVVGRFRRRLVLRRKGMRQAVARVLAEFDVRPPKATMPFGLLSGGNQQKAVIGRALLVEPRLLLLHEPTQGVDVAARQEIIKKVRDLAARGAAVLVATTEARDLVELASRVLIFRDGRVASVLEGPAITTDAVAAAGASGEIQLPVPLATVGLQ